MRLLFILALLFGCASASATRACKASLARAEQDVTRGTARLRAADEAACPILAKDRTAIEAARESFAQCQDGREHDETLRRVDAVLDEFRKTYYRLCPPRAGLIRVNAVFTRPIARSDLPPPVVRLHRCDTPSRMTMMNEPFDGGRLLLAGCSGHADAAPAEVRAKNLAAKTIAGEQVAVYVALDTNGRGAQRLSFPILSADGNQTSLVTLPQSGALPISRDTIAGNWAPADPAVCRIHAEWRVADRKANLVLWQELADCGKHGPPEFKTILDRRGN